MALDRIRLLDEDPDLGYELSGGRLDQARESLWAVALEPGSQGFDPQRYAEPARGGLGLLLLDGLVVRHVGEQTRRSAELLGGGDILRPWQHDGEEATMPLRTRWRVIEPLRFAVLDRDFACRVAPFPEVVGALVGRALQRSRTLATHLAILHHPRVERRVVLLLWHLAERWGRVTPEGVVVGLPLTHELLADLVAARRPSVTTCLGGLAERELVIRRDDGWLLCGDPPGDEAEDGTDIGDMVGVRQAG